MNALREARRVVFVVLLVFLLLPAAALAQGGPYQLTLTGVVMRQGNSPATLKPVVLTTSMGERLETKTDGSGRFVLTGEVMADSGEVEVRSGAVNASFGKMAVTWAAGGPGPKQLEITLITDGESVWAEGSEPPYLSEEPGEGAPTPTPVALPTALPTAPPTPAVVTPAATTSPTPAVNEPAGGVGWLLVVVVGLVLIALGLLGGGVILLLRKR